VGVGALERDEEEVPPCPSCSPPAEGETVGECVASSCETLGEGVEERDRWGGERVWEGEGVRESEAGEVGV